MKRMKRHSVGGCALATAVQAAAVLLSYGCSVPVSPSSSSVTLSGTATGTVTEPQSKTSLKINTVTHRGIDGCWEMTGDGTTLIVVPAWAGRISMLDFGWGNVVFSDPKVDGKVLKPEEGWAPWDGNATDLVQRAEGKLKNQWKGLWLHPYSYRLPLPFFLESRPSEEAKLKVRKAYLPLAGACLYSCIITNTGAQAARWTVWERLLVPGGENAYAICPLKKGDAYKDGYIVRDSTTVEPAEHVQVVGEYLVMRAGMKKGAGLAAQLSRRWMANVSGRHALLMVFDGVDDRAQYPHYSGANAIFWIAPQNIELEPLSPEKELPAGGSYDFVQMWFGLEMPEGLDPADHVAVGKWLDAQATERLGQLIPPAATQPATAESLR